MADAAPAFGRDAVQVARFFHDTYEELAPSFGYDTRPETKVAWDDLPAENRKLMIATTIVVLARMRDEGLIDR